MLDRRNFMLSLLGTTAIFQNSFFSFEPNFSMDNSINLTNKKDSYNIPIIGVHTLLTDPPLGSMLVVNNAIKDYPKGSKEKLLNFFKEINLTALRFYDGYWWSPNGIEKTAYTLYKVGELQENQVETFIKGTNYIDGFEIIDFFGKNNLTLVLHVDSILYDPLTKKVYLTKEVANNAKLLEKATFENVIKFVEYYKKKNYQNKFIIEIGNEGMGYAKDPMPTITERAKIIKAYSKAIREKSSKVQIAFTAEEYLGFYESIENLELLDGCQKNLDYAVFHPYEFTLKMDKKNTPHSLQEVLDALGKRLDNKGFTKTKFLLTEYNVVPYNNTSKRYGYEYAIKNFEIIFPALFHKKVAGIFMHAFPNYEYGNYSDGKNWSIIDVLGKPSHPEDKSNGLSKWRPMATGVIHNLITKFLANSISIDTIELKKEHLIVALRTIKELKILVINLGQDFDSLNIKNIKLKTNKIKALFLEDKNDALPQDLNQSWKIKSFDVKVQNKNKLIFKFKTNSIVFFTIDLKNIE